MSSLGARSPRSDPVRRGAPRLLRVPISRHVHRQRYVPLSDCERTRLGGKPQESFEHGVRRQLLEPPPSFVAIDGDHFDGHFERPVSHRRRFGLLSPGTCRGRAVSCAPQPSRWGWTCPMTRKRAG